MFQTCALALSVTLAQQPGNLKNNEHPALPSQLCTAPGQCTPQETSITLDGNWMWTHKVGQPQNCYTGDNWFVTQQPLCPPRRDWNGKHWKKEKYLKNSTQGPDVVPGPSDVCPKLCSGRWRLRKHVRNFNVGQHHVAEICDERPRLARAQCGIEELPP
eukprot:m.208756 g.208756  ORF g.208756 m.208756 type:complete len:159 (+) comp15460_c0_seq1:185-661(+)